MKAMKLGVRGLTLGLALMLGVSQTACVKRMLINGQAKSTREGSKALDEIGDYQVARGAAQAGLAQMEGMHRLADDNLDVLFMLTRSWTSYGFAFSQDDMESAEEGSPEYEDAKLRAKFAFNRAVKYGKELLGHRAEGLDGVLSSEAKLKTWLKDNFDSKDDAPNLFWAGYAWMARASLLRDDPALVAELYVGVALIRRSLDLDPEYYNSNGYTALASYHARTRSAEPEEAKRLFELVLQKTQRKSLLVQVSYAERYACVMADRKLYDSLLNEALSFDLDSAPQNRLQNTIARRRAVRATSKNALANCGFNPDEPVVKRQSGEDTGELSLEDFMQGAEEEAPEPPPAEAPAPEVTPAPAPKSGAKPSTTPKTTP